MNFQSQMCSGTEADATWLCSATSIPASLGPTELLDSLMKVLYRTSLPCISDHLERLDQLILFEKNYSSAFRYFYRAECSIDRSVWTDLPILFQVFQSNPPKRGNKFETADTAISAIKYYTSWIMVAVKILMNSTIPPSQAIPQDQDHLN